MQNIGLNTKGIIFCAPPSGFSGESIGDINGVKSSANLQVTHDGGSLDNENFMEKTDGEGGKLDVYCSCRDALLGIRIT